MTRSRCCAVVALGCVMFAGGSATVCGQEKVGGWTIEYQTKALTVEDIQEPAEPPSLRIKVRNISGKPINGMAVSHGSHPLSLDFAAKPDALEPGATYTISPSVRPQDQFGTLRVTAVLFEDGSAEGDPAVIERMQFGRLGMALEAARWLPILQKLGQSQLDTASIRALVTPVGSGPKSLDEALNSFTEPSPLKEKLRGASANAVTAFLDGVANRRTVESADLEQLTKLPAASPSSAARRSTYLVHLEGSQQSAAKLLERSQRDMGIEK